MKSKNYIFQLFRLKSTFSKSCVRKAPFQIRKEKARPRAGSGRAGCRGSGRRMPPRRGKCLVADKQRRICSEHRHAGRNSHTGRARAPVLALAQLVAGAALKVPRWWHWAQYFMASLGKSFEWLLWQSVHVAGLLRASPAGRSCGFTTVPLSSVSAVESASVPPPDKSPAGDAGGSRPFVTTVAWWWLACRPWRCRQHLGQHRLIGMAGDAGHTLGPVGHALGQAESVADAASAVWQATQSRTPSSSSSADRP